MHNVGAWLFKIQMFALKKEARPPIFVFGTAKGKGILLLLEFAFTSFQSYLSCRVFQQHLKGKNVLTAPSFLCLKDQRITQIPFFQLFLTLVPNETPGNLLRLWLLSVTHCSSSECKTASAMPFLTWKYCFSCGPHDIFFLTGPLLSYTYTCYHEDTFLCPSTASGFYVAGKETYSPHPRGSIKFQHWCQVIQYCKNMIENEW